MARALGAEFRVHFIHVKGPEILDKYIGGSEANVRRLFEEAEAKGPTVLFFDEIDSIVPMRSSSTAAVTDRIVNQFLCYLDGVVPLKKTFVVAATSRPDLIDTAVLRPGRIDTHVFCGLPSLADRLLFLNSTLTPLITGPLPSDAVHQLAGRTEGYSFADLTLAAQKLRTRLRAAPDTDALGHFSAALDEVKPFCRTKDFPKLEGVFRNFLAGTPDPQVLHQRHTLA